MFATVIIILPSQFTGGAVHLKHNDNSVVYDTSETSLFETTVLAWYTDVQHEVKPVTSGYRLALSYNLVHTTQSIRPVLSNDTTVLEGLAEVFGAWKNQDMKTDTEMVYYLLDHKYSQANLHVGALKGADAQKVGMLQPLAERHGFEMGFASVECHLTGSANMGYQESLTWEEGRGYLCGGDSDDEDYEDRSSDGDEDGDEDVYEDSDDADHEGRGNVNRKVNKVDVPDEDDDEIYPAKLRVKKPIEIRFGILYNKKFNFENFVGLDGAPVRTIAFGNYDKNIVPSKLVALARKLEMEASYYKHEHKRYTGNVRLLYRMPS